MIWAGHVERMGEESAYRALMGQPQGKSHLEDQGVDGRIILKLILSGLGTFTGLIWLRIGTGVGLL